MSFFGKMAITTLKLMHSGKVGGVLVFCAFNTASNWLKWFKTSLTAHDVEPSRVCYLNILIGGLSSHLSDIGSCQNIFFCKKSLQNIFFMLKNILALEKYFIF